MPVIGFSRPYAAKYNNNGGSTTYTDGIRAGRGVSYEGDVETADGNVFRADNQDSESVAGRFSGGTGTLTTAERDRAFELLAQGIREREIQIDDETTVKEIVYDDDANPPNLGVGGIIKKMVNGVEFYDAFIFTKQKFDPPSDSYTTEGEEIDWQTQEWTSTILRDDTPKHAWRMYARDLATEALADKYIRYKLGMAIEDIGTLAITSARGTTEGSTIITVTPTADPDNIYMYRLGNNMQLPYYDQDVSDNEGFSLWDGVAEIDAQGMSQILLVEATPDMYARKAALATIIASERSMTANEAAAHLEKLAEG